LDLMLEAVSSQLLIKSSLSINHSFVFLLPSIDSTLFLVNFMRRIQILLIRKTVFNSDNVFGRVDVISVILRVVLEFSRSSFFLKFVHGDEGSVFCLGLVLS